MGADSKNRNTVHAPPERSDSEFFSRLRAFRSSVALNRLSPQLAAVSRRTLPLLSSCELFLREKAPTKRQRTLFELHFFRAFWRFSAICLMVCLVVKFGALLALYQHLY